ncbi:hypothetical protein FTO68_04180 [Methanocalculus taiwanensis]|uniref:Methionyl-tRNA formyltransferase n=1 Tax=Methanocalculus taiwanensis TaxID=106207 RepID=A0ABD4TLM9_9EURY|nr:formyltransferase family protein [Methanocalculus taiwanensis]MCQ1538190.1 hypothetical protein [Methanocalculus taiwanensis]
MTNGNDNNKLRIAFLGTYHPAVPTFRALAKKGWICIAVLPEESGYKNNELLDCILEFNIPWTYNINEIVNYSPNILIAANYPKIVPSCYLDMFPCINTHWSLLPRWRGVHPTAWALINGDENIGLSVHLMGNEFDTGAILTQDSMRITPDLTINEIHVKLAQMQASSVIAVLEDYLQNGHFTGYEQDHKCATYVPQRVPIDGIINWGNSTSRIEGLVRALPLPKYPGAFTYLDSQKIIIVSAKAADCPPYHCTPGQVVRVLGDGSVWIKTGDTCLIVERIAIEGEEEIKEASKLLKRGMKLGYNPQIEIAKLKNKVKFLEEKISEIEDKIRK